ncbi:siderophore ABC transporter substrate-binding protein [Paenibacillus senegalensis]|uniref:siderophore ABC transporter substrate-binding protein n=1 Tax=Paenibacillus senegalensis TaxID=1465766 RepID=UPI000288031C|nr:siderophore ABC transporter substrate-binding protein [Paenibacillus senegalensis]
MNRKLSLILLVLAFSLVVAACGSQPTSTPPEGENANQGAAPSESPSSSPEPGQAESPEELVITHELGETPVTKNPEKIVVFDFGVLDSLDKLGIEVTGVPQANIPPYLSKYEDSQYINVGSLKEADFEAISEIDPDLIIISGRQSEFYDELSKLGPTIFLGVDTSRYLESYEENARVLGEIFGKEAEVEAELEAVENAIAALNEKATASGKNALIILANDGNISAYGPGSRFGILHDVFGLAPVDDSIEVSTHGMTISFEYIQEKNPDYLFVVDRGAVVTTGESTAKQIVENELVKRTTAYEEDQIVYLDPNYWYLSGGGLISVAEMVKEVDAAVK